MPLCQTCDFEQWWWEQMHPDSVESSDFYQCDSCKRPYNAFYLNCTRDSQPEIIRFSESKAAEYTKNIQTVAWTLESIQADIEKKCHCLTCQALLFWLRIARRELRTVNIQPGACLRVFTRTMHQVCLYLDNCAVVGYGSKCPISQLATWAMPQVNKVVPPNKACVQF